MAYEYNLDGNKIITVLNRDDNSITFTVQEQNINNKNVDIYNSTFSLLSFYQKDDYFQYLKDSNKIFKYLDKLLNKKSYKYQKEEKHLKFIFMVDNGVDEEKEVSLLISISEISKLKEAVKLKDEEITKIKEGVKLKDEEITKLKEAVKLKDEEITKSLDTVKKLNSKIFENEKEIQKLKKENELLKKNSNNSFAFSDNLKSNEIVVRNNFITPLLNNLNSKKEGYEKGIYLSLLAEKCNFFEDMSRLVMETLRIKDIISSGERNLLSISFKNSISKYRQGCRTINAYKTKEMKKSSSEYLNYILDYQKIIHQTREKYANEYINFVEKIMIPKSQNDEERTFWNKMIGDYHRYIAEDEIESSIAEKHADLSKKSYDLAFKFAEKLGKCNATKAGLYLNYSDLLYVVKNEKNEAIKIVEKFLKSIEEEKKALNEDDDNSKDFLEICNLIQENLNAWKK